MRRLNERRASPSLAGWGDALGARDPYARFHSAHGPRARRWGLYQSESAFYLTRDALFSYYSI